MTAFQAGGVALAVIGAFAVPNLAIMVMHHLARRSAPEPSMRVPIKNFAEVDERLWRGGAPDADGYRSLAGHGVVTVVDLRAEEGLDPHDALISELGLRRVHIPLRDGQAPTEAQVSRFMEAVAESPGRVFVHCGAGVGRTGTMAGSYLVRTGVATPWQSLERNLAVGPPSIEQLVFTARLGSVAGRPLAPVVALSRLVDAPRRIWNRTRSRSPRISTAPSVLSRPEG